MSLKKTLLFISFSLISLISYSQNAQKHEVMPGETLYSLGRRYNVTVDALKKANNLSSDAIKAGQLLIIPSSSSTPTVQQQNSVNQSNTPSNTVSNPSVAEVTSPSAPQSTSRTIEVQIPRCKLTYITEKKTTVAEICVKFGISENEFILSNPEIKKFKIKKGTSICIPYTESERSALIKAEAAAQAEAQRKQEESERALREAEIASRRLEKINVSVILPFELSHERKSQEAIKMIDFYEGMLLAIDDLQSKGANVELQVYDEQETPIDSILSLLSQHPCHLIIGAKNIDNINALRSYSKRNNIILAVPFSSKEDLTVGHPNLFQVNMKSSLLYDQVYKTFTEENRDAHVLFVTCPRTDDNNYIKGFERYLSEHNISHSTIDADDLSKASSLSASGKRVVLIPSDKSVETFKKIISTLDGYESRISSNISLFGYPEWQTFSVENTNKLRLYHCSFYTTFYADLSSDDVLSFTSRFKKRFNRDQYNSRPLYGLLGYDVTNYFIGGLHKYGTAFIDNQDAMKTESLQNPMLFERNYSSRQNGFTNHNIRIIHP